MSLQQFNAAIDAFTKVDVPEQASLALRALAAQGFIAVTLKSPVDKGRFRWGWHATVGASSDWNPPESEDDTYPDSSAVISAGLGVINAAPPYSLIIIQNNVEYAEDLEGGHSGQAPQGVLAVTVAELEDAF